MFIRLATFVLIGSLGVAACRIAPRSYVPLEGVALGGGSVAGGGQGVGDPDADASDEGGIEAEVVEDGIELAPVQPDAVRGAPVDEDVMVQLAPHRVAAVAAVEGPALVAGKPDFFAEEIGPDEGALVLALRLGDRQELPVVQPGTVGLADLDGHTVDDTIDHDCGAERAFGHGGSGVGSAR